MNLVHYMLEIRFASPFFMGIAAFAVFAALFVFGARKAVRHPYIGFFRRRERRRRRRNYGLWAYRILMWVAVLLALLVIGDPSHEEYEIQSREVVSYIIVADFSGSIKSVDDTGNPTSLFENSLLNVIRLSLTKFVRERKDTSEFFLLGYSDTPYAARYFAGGKEAETQIGGFLEDIPKELPRWQRYGSEKFYLGGTYTAFALEAAIRYREAFPAQYRESVFVILSDLEDTAIGRLSDTLDTLAESGIERDVYVIGMVHPKRQNVKSIADLQTQITHPDRVHIMRAHDERTLNAALSEIAEQQGPPSEVTREVFHTRSFRPELISALLVCVLCFITIEELYVRRIP